MAGNELRFPGVSERGLARRAHHKMRKRSVRKEPELGMPALSKRVRAVSGSRLMLALVMLSLIAAGFPAGAQSPVASYPPIKLIHLYQHTCPAGVDPLAVSLTDAANA